MSELTPMMEQYLRIKNEHQDSVLFFRLGDFYEMFNEDAIEVSRLLNLTLTQRGGYPMCGIPHHASKNYISRLLKNGKKIAVCEQVSDPAERKGLVERKVVEVITPGTALEDDYLEQTSNNYLLAVASKHIGAEEITALAYIDISTGSFAATSFNITKIEDFFPKEIGRIQPREILIQQSFLTHNPLVQKVLNEYPSLVINTFPDWSFNLETSYKRLCSVFNTKNLNAFGLTKSSAELLPAGFLIEYIEQTAGAALAHISSINVYIDSEFVSIDDSSRKNLELIQNLRDASQSFTLFEVLNHTRTTMGTRLLRHWILHPLISIHEIETRNQVVDFFYRNQKKLSSVRKILSKILDIERLSGRIATQRAHAKDIFALGQSLKAFCSLQEIGKNKQINFFNKFGLEDYVTALDLCNLISNSILEEAPILISEGKMIKRGWSKKLDELHELRNNSNAVLKSYLESERETTGISNLKIKYNKLIGYFLEVTKGQLASVPDHFIKRRSLTNSDRFTTEKLIELETELNNVSAHIIEHEKKIFLEIRETIGKKINELLRISKFIASLDVLQSFAHCATLHTWVKPQFIHNGTMHIIEGRHPVVENYLKMNEFIPNDIFLSSDNDQHPSFALITGPNMSGKSTFLRQTALINLIAQIGCYVPAEEAILTPIDKIFCRVGASDNLARGESTFLVEMTEAAYILRTATKHSLIIMDEIGRGTSTEDGLSIARAITEYILDIIGAKTLFATHYHELARIQKKGLIHLCLDVLETEGEVIFLKKIIEGISANSYGIHVARLAGVPEPVITRARDLLSTFTKNKQAQECNEKDSHLLQLEKKQKSLQEFLFTQEDLIIEQIQEIDPHTITPIEALKHIDSWKKQLKI